VFGWFRWLLRVAGGGFPLASMSIIPESRSVSSSWGCRAKTPPRTQRI